MVIPLNAQVECPDGICGRSTYVLINPVFNDVTHVVVKRGLLPKTEYLVPVEYVAGSITNTIRLGINKTEIEKMEPFIKSDYTEEAGPVIYAGYRAGAGELAVHHGTRVEATDGYLGKVDEIVIDSKSCQITHLVVRAGYLWEQKDVFIPLSALGDTFGNTVFLKLNMHEIEGLPTFPLRRRWS